MTDSMPAVPEELIERALAVVNEHMGGYHATQWRQRNAVQALAELGLLADPGLRAELDDLRQHVRNVGAQRDVEKADNERLGAEVVRLRARIHEAVDETQRRYAKYQKAYHDHRNTVVLAKRWYSDAGTDFGHTSAAGRALVVDLIEQRDLLLWLHAEAVWRRARWREDSQSTHRRLDERQARINAATALAGHQIADVVESLPEAKFPADILAVLLGSEPSAEARAVLAKHVPPSSLGGGVAEEGCGT